MEQYISKSALVAELEKRINEEIESYATNFGYSQGCIDSMRKILSFLDTLEVNEVEVDLTDRKTDWSPSKKQMESLKDMLKYNIGVFDYQKFMEVNSLYDDLKKILDYESNRQK